jgi:uncharacterized protein with PQ loop repeat
MGQASKAMRHLHKKKPDLYSNTVEKLAYAAGIISPIVTLPQLIQIWISKDATGVSLITWVSYLIIVLIMTSYGVLHKEKPLIIMYGTLIPIDFLIILGAIIY